MAAFLKFITLNLKTAQRDFYQLRGNTVRVVSAAVDVKIQSEDGSLDIVLKEGEQATLEDVFYRLLLWHDSGVDQLVTLSLSEGGQIGSAKVSGNVSIAGTANVAVVGNPAVTLLNNGPGAPVYIVDKGSSYGASYKSNTPLAANTPETVFAPAANSHGAIVHAAMFYSSHASNSQPVFIAKSSAPTGTLDGDVILSPDSVAVASSREFCASLKNPLRIQAGKGLYFIAGAAESLAQRSALYTLL